MVPFNNKIGCFTETCKVKIEKSISLLIPLRMCLKCVPKEITYVKHIPNKAFCFLQKAILTSSERGSVSREGWGYQKQWQSDAEAEAEEGGGGVGKS